MTTLNEMHFEDSLGLDDEPDENTICVHTGTEGDDVYVPKKIIRLSGFLNTLMNVNEENGEETKITLPNEHASSIAVCIKYMEICNTLNNCEQLKITPPCFILNKGSEYRTEFENAIISLLEEYVGDSGDNTVLYKLAHTTNYLHIEGFFQLVCLFISKKIKELVDLEIK
jgi:hypothetical protein